MHKDENTEWFKMHISNLQEQIVSLETRNKVLTDILLGNAGIVQDHTVIVPPSVPESIGNARTPFHRRRIEYERRMRKIPPEVKEDAN